MSESPPRQRDVFVLGSLNMDIVTFCQRHPRVGETVAGRQVSFFPGGKGANQSIAAAKAAGQCDLIGAAGTDAFGTQLIEFLRGQQVNVDAVGRTDVGTGVAAITVADDGTNTIVVTPGANACVAVDAEIFRTRTAPVVVAQFETPRSEIASVFGLSRAVGGTNILNPSPYSAIEPQILSLTDVIILNETEFSLLYQTDPSDDPVVVESVMRKQGAVCGDGVVTLGARGCLVWSPDTYTYHPAHPVRAVDTTGAGDCFAGFFAGMIARGLAYADAARWANAAAALSATREGAGPSMPAYADVVGVLERS